MRYNTQTLYIYILSLLLVMALVVIAYLLMGRAADNKQPQQIVVLQNKEKEEPATNSNLPINPTRDPVYPIRNSEYQLVGTLTSIELNPSDKPMIIPLFGRRIRSDRWQYYTTTESESYIRLDVSYENQMCKDIIGCYQISDGAVVYVPQYNREFKVSLYSYDQPMYNPYSV